MDLKNEKLTDVLLDKLGFERSCYVDEDQEEFYYFKKENLCIHNSAYCKSFKFSYKIIDYEIDLIIETVGELLVLYKIINKNDLITKV